LPYPNTTELAGIMKVNDTPAILRAAQPVRRRLIVGSTTQRNHRADFRQGNRFRLTGSALAERI
jgi:hypothetical protein